MYNESLAAFENIAWSLRIWKQKGMLQHIVKFEYFRIGGAQHDPLNLGIYIEQQKPDHETLNIHYRGRAR